MPDSIDMAMSQLSRAPGANYLHGEVGSTLQCSLRAQRPATQAAEAARAWLASVIRQSYAGATDTGAHGPSLAYYVDQICEGVESQTSPLSIEQARCILRLSVLLPIMAAPPHPDARLSCILGQRPLRLKWVDGDAQTRTTARSDARLLEMELKQLANDIVRQASQGRLKALTPGQMAHFEALSFGNANRLDRLDGEAASRAVSALRQVYVQTGAVSLEGGQAAQSVASHLGGRWPELQLVVGQDGLSTQFHADGPANCRDIHQAVRRIMRQHAEGMDRDSVSNPLWTTLDRFMRAALGIRDRSLGTTRRVLTGFLEAMDQYRALKRTDGKRLDLGNLLDFLDGLDDENYLVARRSGVPAEGAVLCSQPDRPSFITRLPHEVLVKIFRNTVDPTPTNQIAQRFFDTAISVANEIHGLPTPVTVGEVRALMKRLFEEPFDDAMPFERLDAGPRAQRFHSFYWHGGNDAGKPYRSPPAKRHEAFFSMMNRQSQASGVIVTDRPHHFVASQQGLSHATAGNLDPFSEPNLNVLGFDDYVAPQRHRPVIRLLELAHEFALKRYQNKGVAADVFKIVGPLIHLLAHPEQEAVGVDADTAHALTMSNVGSSLTEHAEILFAMQHRVLPEGFHGFDQDMVAATGQKGIEHLEAVGLQMAKNLFAGTLSDDFDAARVGHAIQEIVDTTPVDQLQSAIQTFLLRQTVRPSSYLLKEEIVARNEWLRKSGQAPEQPSPSTAVTAFRSGNTERVYELTGLKLFESMPFFTGCGRAGETFLLEEVRRSMFGVRPGDPIDNMHDLSWIPSSQ